MSVLGIIPARYASQRFPGKPLADILGKPMIQHVYEQASQCARIDSLYVATDDERIASAVEQFGGHCVMTQSSHRSGTDRCNEALQHIEQSTHSTFDIVVNIQGDEPLISPAALSQLIESFNHPQIDIVTLVKPITTADDLHSPNVVKCVKATNGAVLYFSRHTIPYMRNVAQEHWLESHRYWKHVGIYAYKSAVLRTIATLEPSLLEQAESLEQLRWLENDLRVFATETQYESISIDTPEDLEKVTTLLVSDTKIK
ncbi:3-deoxy-manno-octulosonate cytidylyltransferase [Bacteroidia bacterium]|nr:3-deoxy-manno-octulosonate cytidylyltransferase [Bacteroidia bacterium]